MKILCLFFIAGALIAQAPQVPHKWHGTVPPGAGIGGNLPGDLYLYKQKDSDDDATYIENVYICKAPEGTAAPACSDVSASGWVFISKTYHNDNAR